MKRVAWIAFFGFAWLAAATAPHAVAQDSRSAETLLWLPTLKTDNGTIDSAYRIALGDLLGNVQPFQSGLLNRPVPVILAGLDYGRPWTRDASINAWNGASLIMPDVARHTLLSVLERTGGEVRIGGQYWDCVVWVAGAWNHYLYTGDQAFLALALEASKKTLSQLEKDEFDARNGLFRGPGWSDGVAGYPIEYADCNGSSAILDWPKCHPDQVSRPGYGIPMQALSTNCLYYNAYVTASRMAEELGVDADSSWGRKAQALKDSINRRFWIRDKGLYRFLVGPFGPCDYEEGLGHSYALLFGIADSSQAASIFGRLHITPAGIPCAWPSFPRYDSEDGTSFARHAGTVWPQIQGFWAEAAARARKPDVFGHELLNLANHAARDHQFAEIYHPLSGKIYGGLQERGDRGIVLWHATSRQTWAATAYLRMILLGLAGLRFDTRGVGFEPCVPRGISRIEIRNLKYRNIQLQITIQGSGTELHDGMIDGVPCPVPFVKASETGKKHVVLNVGAN